MEKDKEPNEKKVSQPGKGFFVVKGMNITIPAGGLTIRMGQDGKPKMDPVVFHLGLDMCPYWMEIAFHHLEQAELASNSALEALKNEDKNNAVALTNEFIAGMQAIVASNISLDAFYAKVKEHVDLSPDLIKKWRDNGTARYKQIAEVIRQAFPMKEKSFDIVRNFVKDAVRFRDLAVHPEAESKLPALYPELGINTEWRFVAFRFTNAKNITHAIFSIITQMILKADKVKNKGLKDYCTSLSKNIRPMVDIWERKYGVLYER